MSTETPAMTAAEHFREAERFAESARTRDSHWDRSVDLQAAQVHATLAQTAVAQEYIPTLRQALEVLLPQAQPEDISDKEDGRDERHNPR